MEDFAGIGDIVLERGSNDRRAILVIEDCEPLLFYLNTALITLGYKDQFLAANLFEAQAVWGQHKDSISHIVLNYELPDGVCFEFAALASRECPDVSIIVTTGYDLSTVREASGPGARFQFLQKPFRLLELQEALELRVPQSTFSI